MGVLCSFSAFAFLDCYYAYSIHDLTRMARANHGTFFGRHLWPRLDAAIENVISKLLEI